MGILDALCDAEKEMPVLNLWLAVKRAWNEKLHMGYALFLGENAPEPHVKFWGMGRRLNTLESAR